MKVKIKDLKPNPFRDMENYPINQEKVQSLTNSINQTGFWDNILGRLGKKGYFDAWGEEGQYVGKFNREKEGLDIIEGGYPVRWEWIGKIEIAYGHHRLVVLKKLFKPDDYVDIPVKELDDPTMIRIMANENMNEWETNTIIIDETIQVTKNYLLKHPEIVDDLVNQFTKSGRPTYKYEISGKVISKFLGNKLWYRERVSESLRRLKLQEEGKLDKEAIKNLPHEKAAQIFTRQVENIKNIVPEQQKKAAKRIIERQDFSESGIKSALLDEKYKDKKTKEDKKERDFIEFKNFISECIKDMKRLNEKLEQLFIIKTKLKFDFGKYRDSTEAKDFDCETRILINCLNKLFGKEGKQNVKDKLLQISD